jgi:hypothetical protein
VTPIRDTFRSTVVRVHLRMNINHSGAETGHEILSRCPSRMSSRNSSGPSNQPAQSSRTSMSREPESEAGSWREFDRSATAGSFLADHNLHIRENELDTAETAWYPVDSKSIIDHSAVLYEHISRDKDSGRDSTFLEPIHPVTFDALNTIVKAISRSHVGGRMGQKKGGFRDILDLSIGLWNFRCSKKLFVSFANRIREKEWSQATGIRNQTQHEGWMFIALVFEWGPVFEEASQELICDYSSPDDLPDYLPDELQSKYPPRSMERLT